MFTINNKRQVDSDIHPIYEREYWFDMDTIAASLDSGSISVPDYITTPEQFHDWIMNVDTSEVSND